MDELFFMEISNVGGCVVTSKDETIFITMTQLDSLIHSNISMKNKWRYGIILCKALYFIDKYCQSILNDINEEGNENEGHITSKICECLIRLKISLPHLSKELDPIISSLIDLSSYLKTQSILIKDIERTFGITSSLGGGIMLIIMAYLSFNQRT